jgi:hypothetical protein
VGNALKLLDFNLSKVFQAINPDVLASNLVDERIKRLGGKLV